MTTLSGVAWRKSSWSSGKPPTVEAEEGVRTVVEAASSLRVFPSLI